MHSNNHSNLTTIVLSRKKVIMASFDFTSELFACPIDPYCPGMCSWTSCRGNADLALPASQPLPESEHDLPLRPPPCANEPHPLVSSSCFAFTSEELSKLAEGITPANTSKATAWTINYFQQWMASRNSLHPSDLVPDDILQCTDPELLNNYLSKYVVKTRKSNGDLYPPATIHHSPIAV